MAYVPSDLIVERYANVLVNFALGGGNGIQKGDVVCISAPEHARALFIATRNAVLDAGGHVIPQYLVGDDDRYHFSRDFFDRARTHQLDYFPKYYYRGLVDEMDHMLFILADGDPHALAHANPKSVLRRQSALKQYMDWRRKKEHRGAFTWTIALFGTPAMAREAGLSERAYWNQIIKACFLDEEDPVGKWKAVYKQMETYRRKLNRLSPRIETLHVNGADADLSITLGSERRWLGGEGRNIPSFEIFTSPDWRGTQGWIRFNQPLYYNGCCIRDIALVFKNGRVVKSSASSHEAMLKQMIRTEGADKIGEFSLTDRRHSRITKFMAETLFDENMGGAQGNTHIALGGAYPETHAGEVRALTSKKKERLGFNDSAVHTDIISTTRRTVTAHLTDGTECVMYKDGEFVL